MKLLRTGLLFVPSLVLLLGCQSAGSADVPARPARMGADRISSACIVQMQNFITSKEGLGTVLTPAAFAKDNFLSIAAAPLTDATGNLAQGRERSMPSVYRLSKSAAGCTITRESDGANALLNSCNCVPLG